MKKNIQRLHSYLLRLWCEEVDGKCLWRVSLTHIPDGERMGFPDLAAALDFLQAHTRQEAADG